MADKPKNISQEDAKKYLDSHHVEDYNLVDVREQWEYEEFHLPGATLISLPEVPDRLDEIDGEKTTIVYCAAGTRSAAAASMMCGRGFKEVYNLVGGAMAWQNEYAVGPQELVLNYFSGHETPVQVLNLAYTMENNLGQFYLQMASSQTEKDMAEAFERLASFENAHKAMILNMARKLDPGLGDKDAFEKHSDVGAMEGGIEIEDFLEQNSKYLKTPKGAMEASMMFEAQALDLYMRYSEKIEDKDTIDILRQLAEEEKKHLETLRKLLKRTIA